MLLKMKRTQKTAFGHLRAGVAYRFDKKTSGHSACVRDLLDRGMAGEVTEEDLKAAKVEAEDLAAEQAKAVKKAAAKTARRKKPAARTAVNTAQSSVTLTKPTDAS